MSNPHGADPPLTEQDYILLPHGPDEVWVRVCSPHGDGASIDLRITVDADGVVVASYPDVDFNDPTCVFRHPWSEAMR